MENTQVSSVQPVQQPKANGKHQPTVQELLAKIADLEKAAAARDNRELFFKVQESSGAVSVYSLGRFPVSLHPGQWRKLAAFIPKVIAFLDKYSLNHGKGEWDSSKIENIPAAFVKLAKEE